MGLAPGTYSGGGGLSPGTYSGGGGLAPGTYTSSGYTPDKPSKSSKSPGESHPSATKGRGLAGIIGRKTSVRNSNESPDIHQEHKTISDVVKASGLIGGSERAMANRAQQEREKIEQEVINELRHGTPKEEVEKKYNVKIEEKKVDLKVSKPEKPEALISGDAGLRVARSEKTESEPKGLDERLSPTLGMVAKKEDVNTLLEGERKINKMAKEGSIGATIYMGGKVASLWAEDIMTKVKETLPLEDKGPVIGKKTVGEQLENAAGMAAGALPFVAGLLNQAIGTSIMAAEGRGRINIKKTEEYAIEGGKKQLEYVKEEPVGALLLFAAPEAKGVVETAIYPHRIPMHALVDVNLKSAVKMLPRHIGRLDAYELIKQTLENKPIESDKLQGFKKSVREKTVYHATSNVKPFLNHMVEVKALNDQGLHTGGLYVGPEIYENFLFEEKGNPGALVIEHKGVSDYPSKLIEKVKEKPELHPERGKTFSEIFKSNNNARTIWQSLEPSKREVYLQAKEHVESTPGELVVSPQSTSGIGYRHYEVEGIITPGTELIRALNARSKLAEKLGAKKGEYFMKVGGRHVELLHFGMEFETTPYTLPELYRLKVQGAKEFAKNVGKTVKKPFERARDVLDEVRDIFGEETIRKAERTAEKAEKGKARDIIEDVDRVAEDLRRDFLEDIYREEIRRGMRRPARAFDFGIDMRRMERSRTKNNRRNWRDEFDVPWRNRMDEPFEDGRRPESEPEERRIREFEHERRPLERPPERPSNVPRIPPREPEEERRGRTKKTQDLSDFVDELNEVWSEDYGYMELKHKFPGIEEMLFGKRGKGGLI